MSRGQPRRPGQGQEQEPIRYGDVFLELWFLRSASWLRPPVRLVWMQADRRPQKPEL
ncbi:hypothetical protein HS088_TW01G00176 [Tripterygium wilfordii]|uniref:Uncharacterized protein n=1 Tax=Tripterygium wilfordii TaxID=458696 RepID=A0A7J7E0Y6_TRIWF|nr:hypothetical protein HS088_TW01G00176 [Tripterygium wilfordii]